MGPKRILLAVCLAAAASIVLVPGAGAGNFDEEKMGCTGEAPATCPTGTVGQPYSLTIYLKPPDGGRGEDFQCATFHHGSGTFPPGLSISSEGYIQGTPTEAGSFRFYMEVKYDKEPTCPFKLASQSEFIISINPGVPRLIIGPEQSGVPISTVGAPFLLQMTASLSDAKTWSVLEGQLPPGLALGTGDGVISGSPTAEGTYAFRVQAAMADGRKDDKWLTITVRAPITISAPEAEGTSSELPPSEVGVRFSALLEATGGTGTYTWSHTGSLPPGVEFGAVGDLTGRPTAAGTYEFTLTATDTEGRTATYDGVVEVVPRLAVETRRMKIGKLGRYYQYKLRARGGVAPWKSRIKRGPLPRGIRFDPTVGVFYGSPTKAGTWRIAVEMVDALGVKATAIVRLVVRR